MYVRSPWNAATLTTAVAELDQPNTVRPGPLALFILMPPRLRLCDLLSSKPCMGVNRLANGTESVCLQVQGAG